MAFIDVPNTAMVEMRYSWRNEVCENTLYFEKASAWSLAELIDLSDTMYTDFWIGHMQDQISNECTLIGIRATSLESPTAPQFNTSFTSPSAGGSSDPSVSNNVTWAIQFQTEQRGRSFRGRNYLIGIPTTAVSGLYVTTAFASLVVGNYDIGLGTVATNIGGQHVVVSKYTDGTARLTGLTTPVVAYSYADLAIDSMRRRLAGRGS